MADSKKIIKHKPQKGEIVKASRIKDFKTDDGMVLYGRDITMSNGDSFNYWRPESDKKHVEKLTKGTQIQYKFVTEIEGEKTKHKLKAFRILQTEKNKKTGLVESKADEAEGRIVETLNQAVTFSASYAKDIMIAEMAAGDKWSKKKFETRASGIYDWMRTQLLNENYGEENE